MARTFKLKRGLKKDLPILGEGEPAFTLDEKKLYIGTGQENVVVGSQTEITDHINNKSNPHGVTAAQVQAIPASQKGSVGGVAELGSDGKVPSGQLPALNYDPAGSAATVQNNLNTHAGDTNLHVTTAKQTAWNNAATAANNAASAAVNAHTQANSAYNLASSANTLAASANTRASNAYGQANSAYNLASNAVTKNVSSIVIGNGAKAVANNTISIGVNANTASNFGISLGYNSIANHSAICLGVDAKANGTDSTAIGSEAKTDRNNSVAIGVTASASANSSVAVGDAAKAIERYSSAYGPLANAAAIYSTAIGYGAKTRGAYSSAFGASANANANFSTAIGDSSLVAASYIQSTALGFNAAVTAANSIRLGSTNSSEYSGLYSIRNISASSDKRDKADIKPIVNAMDFLNSLEAIQYVDNARTAYMPEELTEEQDKLREKYTMHRELYDVESHAKGEKKGERKRVGVLAQEVQEKMLEIYGTDNYAELVHDNLYDRKQDGEEFPDGVEELLSVNYTSFIPFLIKAVQELSAELKEVKTESGEAKTEIGELKEKLNV